MCNSDWNEDCTGSIANYCAAGSFASTLASLFEGLIGDLLAEQIAETAMSAFAGQPLEAVGQLDVQTLLPIESDAHPVGYLLTASTDSPSVTGAAGALGLNVDFDSGFAGDHHACVPMRAFQASALPPPPDLGATIDAPDPITGEMRPETFHLAALVGDEVLRRAALELFDAGGLCLDLEARAVHALSGGGFTPTLAVLALVAPGLALLGPPEAAVDLGITPRFPMAASFGSGQDTADGVDSHIKIDWPGVGVAIYPLVDDSYLRALAFETDLHLGLSLEPTPQGSLQIMIDSLVIDNVAETYNEIGLVFSAADFVNLVLTFLPTLLADNAFDVALTAQSIGFPLVPKVRALGRADAGGRYLAVFLRFCAAEQIADPTDALCYEAAAIGAQATADVARAAVVAGPGGALASDTVRVRLYEDTPALAYEVAYRIDGSGPFFSFRGADDDGLFTLAHPLLRLAGAHTLEVMARPAATPWRWSEVMALPVYSDHRRPEIRDEAGHESRPLVGRAVESAPSGEAHAEGCAAVASWWVAVGASLLLRRRPRRAY